MKKAILLLLIVAIAFFLRFYKVSDNPPALSWDEVSIGYNAYSILKTGKDEHGRFLPLDAFAGYGDYKPPLSIYITVPFVALFGLNELSVRLPSVLFGTGVVILVYLVALELLQRSGSSKALHLHLTVVALVSALAVAISPWHINLSRAGFEANIGLFFTLLGIFVILRARKYPNLWAAAWLPFVAAVYTFNSSRYFVPFMGVGLMVYCWKYILQQKKYFFTGLIVALVFLLPILPHLFSKEARLRFVEVNIFSDSSVVETSNRRIEAEGSGILSKMLHNRRLGYARSFLMHYFDHFSPDFLFIKGDGNPKFSTQDVGQLYSIDLPFLLVGAYFMYVHFPKAAMLMTYWLLTALIPAAVARETPHALRILNSLPVWHMFIGFGVVMFVYEVMKNHKRSAIAGIALLYLLSAGYYLHNYYVHYPRMYSNEWQYGYKQALDYIGQHENDYDKIYISEFIGRAYMYTLFYTGYDPDKFLKLKSSYFDAAGFYHVDGFDKYIFSSSFPSELNSRSLYIFSPSQTPEGAVIKKRIPLINGEEVLTVFEKG